MNQQNRRTHKKRNSWPNIRTLSENSILQKPLTCPAEMVTVTIKVMASNWSPQIQIKVPESKLFPEDFSFPQTKSNSGDSAKRNHESFSRLIKAPFLY